MRVARVLAAGLSAAALSAVAVAGVPALAGSSVVPAGSDVSPQVSAFPPTYRLGQSIDAAPPVGDCGGTNRDIPMLQKWTGTGGSGPVTYDVTNLAGEGGPSASGTTATSIPVEGTSYDNDCGGGIHPDRLQVTAHGGDYGNVATSVGRRFFVTVYEQNEQVTGGVSVAGFSSAYTGAWSSAACACFNAGSTAWTSASGATARFTVNTSLVGQELALVSPVAVNRGSFTISVDGKAAQTVDTHSAAGVNRVIVWQTALTAGKHTVVVKNLATTGHPRIDIDALLLTEASL